MRYTILFLLLPALLWGQYPNNPRKLRLGTQTTGAGLTYIQSGAPSHTPADDEDAWMVMDTTNNVLYYYDEAAGAWENILDDVVRDTVFRITYVPDTSTIVALQGDLFINTTADTLGAYDGAGWQLYVGDGNGIYSSNGTISTTRTVNIDNAGEFKFSGQSINFDLFEFGESGSYFNIDLGDLNSIAENQARTQLGMYDERFILTAKGNPADGAVISGNIEIDTQLVSIYGGLGTPTKNFLQVNVREESVAFFDKYMLPNASPSTTLNDTTVMAWRGTGSGASPVGFVPYGGGGSSVVGHDTSAYFHRRLTFGTDYTLPAAVLDTADIISIYAGALGATSATITLPTLSDTLHDGKIIYVRGSASESGGIMRITSPDSTDILVQGCTAITVQDITPTDSTNIDINLATSYANTSGPDTITATYSVLYMYLISNGKYYRYCQQKQQEAPLGKIFQIDMTTAATSTTVTFNAPSNPENGGVYTFHFQNTASNEVDFPATFLSQSGTAWDASTTFSYAEDGFVTCYYDGTNYYCK